MPVTAPHYKLRLLTETSALWSAVGLVPNERTSPYPSRPLQSIGHRRQLPPVDKHTDGRAFFGASPCLCEPFRHPVGPRALVFGIAFEVRQDVVGLGRGIFLCRGFLLAVLVSGSRCVRRVADDAAKQLVGEGGQHMEQVTVDDFRADETVVDVVGDFAVRGLDCATIAVFVVIHD